MVDSLTKPNFYLPPTITNQIQQIGLINHLLNLESSSHGSNVFRLKEGNKLGHILSSDHDKYHHDENWDRVS